jgi:Leucine-rich repeat (LRR) protein
MKKALLASLLLCSSLAFAQDYSSIGKSIAFSDTLKNASKYKNIDKALEHPEEVIYLEILNSEGINKFSANTSRFKNLRKLILQNTSWPISNISDSIWSLKKLEYLVLRNFPGLSITGIKNLQQLKYLSLDGLSLKEFPAEALELTKLEYLDLSCNSLSTLPGNIGKLTNLKELELTNNCFTNCPPELSRLPSLIYFTMNNPERNSALSDGTVVCNNTITEFPTVFQNMPNLKKVSCFFKLEITDELKNKIKSSYPNIKFS